LSKSNNYPSNIDKATEIIFNKLDPVIDVTKNFLKEWRFNASSENLINIESSQKDNQTNIPQLTENIQKSTHDSSNSDSKFTKNPLICNECGLSFRLQINLRTHKLGHK
jgi:hypothetical protein